MENEIDLGKISITPKGGWTPESQVEYNDIWRYGTSKYLALKNSIGIPPADDKINWYELSSSGKSAYQQAVENGFVGTESAWVQSLKQPALDAAGQASAAVENMDKRFPEKLAEIKANLSEQIKQEVADRVVKPVVVSFQEYKTGSFHVGGESHDLYERTFHLSNLPQASGTSCEFILSSEALGYGIYLSVEGFCVTTGKKLKSEFFHSIYELERIYVNENLSTVAVIKCLRTTVPDLTATLRLMYCKFSGDIITFEIDLPQGVDADNVHLTFPPLKYNKKVIFSYINDDSYSIWNNIFCLVNQKWVCDELGTDPWQHQPNWRFFYHYGMEEGVFGSTGIVPEKPLEYSDGCGVKHRFATTVATWVDKLTGSDEDRDRLYGPEMLWNSAKETRIMFDFGYTVGWHDVFNTGDIKNQENFDTRISEKSAVFKKMIDVVPKSMIEPNGDHDYITYSRNNNLFQFILAQSGPGIETVYPFKSGFTLDKNAIAIKRIFAYGTDAEYVGDLFEKLKSARDSTDKSTIPWLVGSAHRCVKGTSEIFKQIENTYGCSGDDSVWLPSLDEFFEYWFMTTQATVGKVISGRKIKFTLYLPCSGNFWFKSVSCLLSGISTTEGLTLSSSCSGESSGISEGKLLVNLDFNPGLLDKVERYVRQFEKSENKYDYEDAAYFIQHLKPSLQSPYLNRINALTAPPTLVSITINQGAISTYDKNVTVRYTSSGKAATAYMISEKSDFSDAVWQTLSQEIPFALSGSFGGKTVYLKLRNGFGESSVSAASITMLEPELQLTSLQLNSGSTGTSDKTVRVSFAYLGYPTHYMISEDSEFIGCLWSVFTENPEFALTDGYGIKTVYAKLKNATTEPGFKSASIELLDTVTVRLNSVTINNGDTNTDSGSVQITFDYVNTVTKYKIGRQPDLSDCAEWIVWSGSTVQYNSGIVDGELTVYARVGNESTESSIKSDSILVVQAIVLNGIVLADGKDSFAGYTVPVSFEISSGTPTHYRLSETSAGLSSSVWLTWNDSITYKFPATGDKTLYAQVKNQVCESPVINSRIIITEPPQAVVLGFNGAKNKLDTVIVKGDTICQTDPATYMAYSSLALKNTQGLPTEMYLNLLSTYYQSNVIFSDNGTNMFNNINTISSADDSGVYPKSVFERCYAANANVPEGTKKLRISFKFPAGAYKIRILYSPSDQFLLAEQYRENSYYGVFCDHEELVRVKVGQAGFTGKGNNQYNNELHFILESEKVIDLAAWQEGATTQGCRPGWNLVEIVKLS